MAAVTIPVISTLVKSATTTTHSTAAAATTTSAVAATTVGQDATVRTSFTATTANSATSTTKAAVTSTTAVASSSTLATSITSTSKLSSTVASSSTVKQVTTVVVVAASTSTSATHAPTVTSTIAVTASSSSTSSSSSTATASSSASNSSDSGFHLSTPIIAGTAAAAGIVIIVALSLFILSVRRSKRRGREERRTSNLRGWTENRMSVINGGVHGRDEDEDDDVTPYGMAGGREDKQLGWQGQGEKYGQDGGQSNYYVEPSMSQGQQPGGFSPYPQQMQHQQPYSPQLPYQGQPYPVAPSMPMSMAMAAGTHRDTYASAPRSVSGSASGYGGYGGPQSPYAASDNMHGGHGSPYPGQGMGMDEHAGAGMGMVGMAVAPEAGNGQGVAGGLKDGMRVVVRQGFVRSMEDELMITPGDELLLVSTYDDGWCLCEDLQHHRGVVPLNCLEQIRAGATPITSPTLPNFPTSASSSSLGMRMDPAETLSSQSQGGLGVSVPQLNVQRSATPDEVSGGQTFAAPSYQEAVGTGSASRELPKEKSGLAPEPRLRKTDSLAPSLAPTDPRWSNRRSSLLANYAAANMFLDDPAHSHGH